MAGGQQDFPNSDISGLLEENQLSLVEQGITTYIDQYGSEAAGKVGLRPRPTTQTQGNESMTTSTNRKSDSDSLPEGITRCAVVCPMCGHQHSQYRMNPHLYWFTDMEMDRKPTGYQCRRSLEGYYAPLYEIWHCPDCHYSAHNRVFPDPLKNVYIEKNVISRRLREHRAAHPEFDRIARALGDNTPFETTDFAQAIRLSMLAIYCERFITDILKQNQASLARAYLRLAWLYRDWSAMDDRYAENQAQFQAIIDTVRPDWPDCPGNEYEAMEGACQWFDQALDSPAAKNDPLEACGMMMQIARIRIQMKENERAFQQLNASRRSISEELDQATRKMSEDLHSSELTEEERGRLLSDTRKYRNLLDECRSLAEAIRGSGGAPQTDRDRAKAIVAANPKAAVSALRKLMEDAGIPKSLIDELAPAKKEGLLGGLFR